MSILLLLLAPGIFAIYWLIRLQLCLSRVRYLVDTYGLDRKKLRKLSCKELKNLRTSINELRQANDAFGLEALVRAYRA
ncbi:MAG: hypothetical protein B7Y05_00485 [Polynucleobacter sp. 24-46-87]|jgi:hypothetical protein|uniref:hypothetical protein n=1 Tax=unclassified Polynucleobacter TaxID=2640945 RepID=UPI000BCE6486|nr:MULTISPECIES: hypothetical protein [unclassified Polynucleobacter]OYY19467.1 MAG: hypothetical protein B7Y67_05580 [Polynucleobacter sp. 35-46-11]OZA16264.1 MAG: hypothetical protein B7Y05_00485 [Polynucleobacter sp. 24-46-87]OZA74609.1 MAG: hypothetical protein B7X71_13090 [Polynucleobacter sp. 39-46-10]